MTNLQMEIDKNEKNGKVFIHCRFAENDNEFSGGEIPASVESVIDFIHEAEDCFLPDRKRTASHIEFGKPFIPRVTR